MKTLKEKIQEDFIVAMKARDEVGKSALSGIKAKITEAEKEVNNKELSDQEVINVLTKAIKQRRESHEIYQSVGRQDLAERELGELLVLEKYMPPQMSDSEIESILVQLLGGIDPSINQNIKKGKTIGSFNKEHKGKAEIERVIKILEKLVN